MKKRAPLNIRVMAEYGSSGLWGFRDGNNGPFRHGMLECADLKLPRDLCEAFDRWICRYEDENPKDRLDVDTFNAEGLRLAALLKRHLGPGRHVEYQGEDRDGSLLPPVCVE